MTVSDLQRHLIELAKLLDASNAKGVAKELFAIGDALEPFQSASLPHFATFLEQAETYVRTGQLPGPGQKVKKAAAPRKPAAPKPDPAALAGEAAVLYEHAADPSVTPSMK